MLLLGHRGEDTMADASPVSRQIEPEILERLGRLIVQWSYLETLTHNLFTAVIAANPGAAMIITQNISISSITSWIRTVVRYRTKLDDPADVRRPTK